MLTKHSLDLRLAKDFELGKEAKEPQRPSMEGVLSFPTATEQGKHSKMQVMIMHSLSCPHETLQMGVKLEFLMNMYVHVYGWLLLKSFLCSGAEYKNVPLLHEHHYGYIAKIFSHLNAAGHILFCM